MKDLKISNELLNYVFTDNLQSFKVDKIENNILYYFWLNEGFYGDESNCKWEKQNINIYEFAFKCKEWACNKGFIVEIGVHPIIKQNRNDRDYFYAIKTRNGELLKKSNVDEIMKSEPTATFKACNWISEQNK